MVAEGFRVKGKKVAVEAVGPPITFVNVYHYPAYLPDDPLSALAQYGKVKSVTFATMSIRQKKLNGVRVVRIEMSKPVPNFTTIAGHRVMFEYRGMRRVCARCGEVDHMASACSAPYCARCGAFGHETVGCAAECKRCGGHHGTRDCFRRRSYASAIRGFLPANDPALERDPPRGSALPKAVDAPSRLQVVSPKPAPPAQKKIPSYWDTGMVRRSPSNTPEAERQRRPQTKRRVAPAEATRSLCRRTVTPACQVTWKQFRLNQRRQPRRRQPSRVRRIKLLGLTTRLGQKRKATPTTRNRRTIREKVKPNSPPKAYASQTLMTHPSDLHDCQLEPVPHVLLGDFNCVVDSTRDVRDEGDQPTTPKGSPGTRTSSTTWRLDPALLKDDTRRQNIENILKESIRAAPPVTPGEWDRLKAAWKALLQEEGRARKRRITKEMNELLRRIRIIQNADSLTACTTAYLASLQSRFNRLLQDNTQRPGQTQGQLGETMEVDLRELSGNGCMKITVATRPDGTTIDDPAEVEAIIRNYFKATYQETEPGQAPPAVSVMPAKTANQLNMLINAFLWEGKPAPVKRSLLQLPPSEGGLGLPHVLTTSKVLTLKTARLLHQAGNYLGRGLLRYWCGTNNSCLDGHRYPGPLAETPSRFYKVASTTMRMIEKEAPDCDIDADPHARIGEILTCNRLGEEEKQQAKNAKQAIKTQGRGLPRETQDFLWKKAWKLLPTRQRLHQWGIAPDARCPNCRRIETQRRYKDNFPLLSSKPFSRPVADSYLAPRHVDVDSRVPTGKTGRAFLPLVLPPPARGTEAPGLRPSSPTPPTPAGRK
ncbi:hypothetical protein HPB52_022898 [Rhipicephalus sanguineus]|uniref:Tick transposon n=1 Tax=Rhipicephalus sanguineus TaxID=34632 RepID=A0A9D4Q348_RHISA|nr:hypothetical protein HPB52_022898 [Rhipicephalus sanguineus]